LDRRDVENKAKKKQDNGGRRIEKSCQYQTEVLPVIFSGIKTYKMALNTTPLFKFVDVVGWYL